MKRAELVASHEFTIKEVEIPKIQSNEVLIEVEVAGICGSDIHAFEGTHPFVDPPLVLGHEFAGTIVEIGKDVPATRLSIGKKVTIEPSVTCGKCFNCKIGRYNICDDLRVIGFQINGGYAQFVAVPAENIIILNDQLSFEDGAMIEPLAVAVHAIHIGRVEPKHHVLIMGAGTIGNLVAQTVKSIGAKVAVADIIENRLDIVSKLGIDLCLNPKNSNIENKLQGFSPNGVDIIFDCVGNAETLRQSIQLVRKGGRVVIVGVPPGDISLPVHYIQDRELEILGDLMYTRNDFDEAINLVQSGHIKFEPLKTKLYQLKDINDAFNHAITNPSTTLKVLLEIN